MAGDRNDITVAEQGFAVAAAAILRDGRGSQLSQRRPATEGEARVAAVDQIAEDRNW
jgi:hypothetical protein